MYAYIDITEKHETYEDADTESNIVALRIDYYRNEDLKGLWLGGLVVYEQQELKYNNKIGELNTVSA